MSSPAEPGGYPGNPSLPREVRDKILSTFRHTLNLFKEGKTDDCLIGCDFILKMDSRFAPARQLMEKAKNPAAAVDVGVLESLVALTPTRQERVASVETDRLLVRAAESFNARDFDAAIAAAEQVLQVLPGNQNATQILENARQKKNAAPQFEAARQRAIAALEAERHSEAHAALEKMRALDLEHPAVALLERKLAAPAPEVGESTNPGFAMPRPSEPDPALAAARSLDELSLDSLSLDEPTGGAVVPPPPDMRESTGPLSRPGREAAGAALSDLDFSTAGDPSAPPNLWREPAESPGGPSLDPEPAAAYGAPEPPAPPSFSEPEPPSSEQEIVSLLTRGDNAVRAGNRQQAIEIWSRIFLIDINNSEAVGRIEKARQEMAEGNRRIADDLKRGRQSFEAGDFSGAREAFLQVLAADESDATARSYLDRIEQELARPSAGLDLSRKTPAGNILDEELAQSAEPQITPEPAARERETAGAKPAAPSMDRRFVMALVAAVVLAAVVGAYLLLRPARGAPSPASPASGASLEHATMLFRDGKVAETIAELKQIPPGNPDYARAQKLLASLNRKGDAAGAAPAPSEGGTAPKSEATGPSPEAVQEREAGNKALAEKRYIDALKSFNLAAPSFREDPTFAQAIGAASERVNELTPAVKLYNEGEYETAIPILWRIFQGDRTNQDARSYLLRAYYNQGIGQLQNGLYPKAVESFNEVLSVEPQDAEAARHKKFAERYLRGDLDLMGRIYVRHVQQRP